eukprot:Sspe_Gene.52240::Locus_28945_Transcript_1_1_Confidence_1.000_Length_1508::g.52240::m.52240
MHRTNSSPRSPTSPALNETPRSRSSSKMARNPSLTSSGHMPRGGSTATLPTQLDTPLRWVPPSPEPRRRSSSLGASRKEEAFSSLASSGKVRTELGRVAECVDSVLERELSGPIRSTTLHTRFVGLLAKGEPPHTTLPARVASRKEGEGMENDVLMFEGYEWGKVAVALKSDPSAVNLVTGVEYQPASNTVVLKGRGLPSDGLPIPLTLKGQKGLRRLERVLTECGVPYEVPAAEEGTVETEWWASLPACYMTTSAIIEKVKEYAILKVSIPAKAEELRRELLQEGVDVVRGGDRWHTSDGRRGPMPWVRDSSEGAFFVSPPHGSEGRPASAAGKVLPDGMKDTRRSTTPKRSKGRRAETPPPSRPGWRAAGPGLGLPRAGAPTGIPPEPAHLAKKDESYEYDIWNLVRLARTARSDDSPMYGPFVLKVPEGVTLTVRTDALRKKALRAVPRSKGLVLEGVQPESTPG